MSFLWRIFLRFPATCFLQWELSNREGVETRKVQIGQTENLSVSGPATISVNRD